MAGQPISKIQPLDKTIVAQFQIHVADIHMRTRQMNGSQAVRVSRDGTFTQGDTNIDPVEPLVLKNIKGMIAINSWQPMLLSLKNESGLIENLPCSGLFIFYGAIDEVTVRAAAPGDPVRITYVFA